MGNALLGFALLTVIELAISNGFALLEHPKEPFHDERAASTWRIVQAITALSHVEIVRFQNLLGARSANPTNLLLVNLPYILHDLPKGRVRTEIPKVPAIGKSDSGVWNTPALKEYLPSMCKSIASSLFRELLGSPVHHDVVPPDEAFLSTCQTLVQTEYGDSVGADFAA